MMHSTSKHVCAFYDQEPGAPPPFPPMLTDQLELFGTTHHHSTMLIVDEILPPRASNVVPPIPHTQLKTPEFKLAAHPFRNTNRFSSPYPKRVSLEHFPSRALTPSDSSDSISLVSDSGSSASVVVLSEDSKIPKPPGEPGRPGRGGYTLYNALDWSPKSYVKF